MEHETNWGLCLFLYVSTALLMSPVHMVGWLEIHWTLHYAVIWQCTHRCLCYPFIPFTLLHGWCGFKHKVVCLWAFDCGLLMVCVCVCEVTKRPVCGSVSCQESLCPRSGHMDMETTISHPGSGCSYLSVTSWNTADASSAWMERCMHVVLDNFPVSTVLHYTSILLYYCIYQVK